LDACNSPKVLDTISNIVSIELFPSWPYDIGNVNVSINSEDASIELAVSDKPK